MHHREASGRQHYDNIRHKLSQDLDLLLKESLRRTEHGLTFKCEARLGRVAWVVSDSKQQQCLQLRDFRNPNQYEDNIPQIKEEFYTR